MSRAQLGGARSRWQFVFRLSVASLVGWCAFWPQFVRAEEPPRSLLGRPLVEHLGPAAPRLTEHLVRPGGRFLAHVPRAMALESGFVPITDRLAVASGEVEALKDWARSGIALEVTPERRLLLDVATVHQGASRAREEYGLDGRGVYVGVIDSGVAPGHRSLLDENGVTRVEWLLSFDMTPQGLQPELEAEFGCTDGGGCAVLSKADIELLLDDEIQGNEPRDTFGHGTHVASTAAGRDDTYPGVAPGASLLVVQAGGTTGYLSDAEILLGARFIYERAAAAGRPVVVNASLGSSFGAHDGSSGLEQGLAALATGPGRILVVASGNSGGVYGSPRAAYPEPLGSHTEVAVPRGGVARVSLVKAFTEVNQANVYVWMTKQPGDDIEVAFAAGERKSDFVAQGQSGVFGATALGDYGAYDGVIVNGGSFSDLGDLPDDQAVFLWAGRIQGSVVHELVFRGHGNVRLWIESSVAVGATTSPSGVLFPRGRSSGTVGIPASHPDLIAVGASVNRSSWVDASGATVRQEDTTQDGLAYFSSSGPNRQGQIKPDLLAPGENLVAAMAAEADPRLEGASSQFSAFGTCPQGAARECYVVDDEHGVASGTSMAAPQVTGAVALLLQRDPTLDMKEVRNLLRAGARRPLDEGFPSGWYGAGSLDVVGTLLALDRKVQGEEIRPSKDNTRLSIASTFLYPDPKLSVRALLLLRDKDDRAAGGIAENELAFTVDRGTVRVIDVAPGVIELELSAPSGSGGLRQSLSVMYRGEELVRRTLPIGVDPTTAVFGFDLAGGCSMSARSWYLEGAASRGMPVLLGMLPLLLLRRMRRGGERTELSGR